MLRLPTDRARARRGEKEGGKAIVKSVINKYFPPPNLYSWIRQSGMIVQQRINTECDRNFRHVRHYSNSDKLKLITISP